MGHGPPSPAGVQAGTGWGSSYTDEMLKNVLKETIPAAAPDQGAVPWVEEPLP
jgi:hypothetical protein